MTSRRRMLALFALAMVPGCMDPKTPPYGREPELSLRTKRRQVWAVAPAMNLSGQRGVDPLLQADILFAQIQQVRGVTAIPVNRVAEAYAAIGIDAVGSIEQATAVCDLLGCDGLVVPTITIYDPYNPPKFGGSLQLFRRPAPPAKAPTRKTTPDPSAPVDEDEPTAMTAAGREGGTAGGVTLLQSVGMYDAANGSVREAVIVYAGGRNDPTGPMGVKEYFASMDRYCGFAYHALIQALLYEMQKVR